METIETSQTNQETETTTLSPKKNQSNHINEQINTILQKAKQLRGYSVDYLLFYLKKQLPKDQHNLLHAKGLTGQIVEILLGATAQSKPLPDFPELGLEIKTLPIDLTGQPLETTYVCTAPLLPKFNSNAKSHEKLSSNMFNFEESVVYKKLSKVLWIPIIVNKQENQSIRTIGNAFIWMPNPKELELIKSDWLELTEMLYLGNADKVTSHYGEVLQIRPKAANSKVITTGLNPEGDKIATLPRGYYLRAKFTHNIYLKYQSGEDILP